MSDELKPLKSELLNLRLERFYLGNSYTVGRLSIGEKYLCHTLEDITRDLNKDGDLDDPGETKIFGETSIPYGRYRVEVSYSPKFRRLLPAVLGVWGFVGIRIHRGRYPSHTSGCILVGRNNIKGQLTNSEYYETTLTDLLYQHQLKGGIIYINVI